MHDIRRIGIAKLVLIAISRPDGPFYLLCHYTRDSILYHRVYLYTHYSLLSSLVLRSIPKRVNCI